MSRSPSLPGAALRADGCGALVRTLACSVARHPFLFGGGFQLSASNSQDVQSGGAGARGARGERARDIIIKSVCKVGWARCQGRVVSFASPSLYLQGRQVDKAFPPPP